MGGGCLVGEEGRGGLVDSRSLVEPRIGRATMRMWGGEAGGGEWVGCVYPERSCLAAASGAAGLRGLPCRSKCCDLEVVPFPAPLDSGLPPLLGFVVRREELGSSCRGRFWVELSHGGSGNLDVWLLGRARCCGSPALAKR